MPHFCFETSHSQLLSRWAAQSKSEGNQGDLGHSGWVTSNLSGWTSTISAFAACFAWKREIILIQFRVQGLRRGIHSPCRVYMRRLLRGENLD